MSNKIEIIDKEIEYTIEIKVEAAVMKIPAVIGNSYKSIMKYLESKKIKPAGAPYVHYLSVNWDELNNGNKFMMFLKMFTYKWNMLIGFPVKEKLEGEGNTLPGVLEKGKYLRTIHRGEYRKVGDTYKRLTAFAQQNNLKYKNESVEYYINDPSTTKKEELETIVMIPLSE